MCQPYDIHNVLRHSGNASWDRLQPTVTLQRISVCKIVHTFFESFVATLKLHYLIIKFPPISYRLAETRAKFILRGPTANVSGILV